MLPVELAGRIEAPPGFLLVRRVGEAETTAAGIWKPPRYLFSKLSPEAEVVSVGVGATEGVLPGDRVFLASNLPRPLTFGVGSEKIELYRVYPRQILAWIDPEWKGRVDTSGRSPMALWTDRMIDPEPRRDEGDPEGIR